MKQQRNKARLNFSENCYLLFWGIIYYIKYIYQNNKRFQEYVKNIIPALVTWSLIGILVFLVLLVLPTKMDNEFYASFQSSSNNSEYVVDKAALAEAISIYEKEQKEKDDSISALEISSSTSLNSSEITDESSEVSSDAIGTDSESEIKDENESEIKETENNNYSLTEEDLCLLVQAVQHETKIFEESPAYTAIQQYMAASIINRLGTPGFGPGYSTSYSIYDLLSNTVQYENMLWETSLYDPYDATTRANVNAVLNGTASTPLYLYYERCSNVGENYYSAQENFYANYPECTEMKIVYMEQSSEGRYIIFACNPYGAYAHAF